MDTNGTSQHISHQFDKEMEALRHKVLKMGGLVEQQISGAIEALQETDAAAAEKIIRIH
jgi:phosphate transport system protein